MGVNDVRQIGRRVAADLRRILTSGGSARSALASLGGPSRSDTVAWTAETADRHDDYRRAHPLADGRVAVVCVSMRPQMLDVVVANIVHQHDVETDVVFVANSREFDMEVVESAFADVDGAVIVQPAQGTSLGSALNLAMETTHARFVAKFDDDDLYGPHYLADALRAHGYAGAGVVGKHSYYACISETGATHLRFPGNEFRYSGTLAGGTLVIDRDRIGEQRFDDISLGEDRAFLAECHRRGFSTFAADRFNFIQMRTGVNSWAIDDTAFLEHSVAIDPETLINR